MNPSKYIKHIVFIALPNGEKKKAVATIHIDGTITISYESE